MTSDQLSTTAHDFTHGVLGRNERELGENLRALEDGPLQPDEMAFVRRFGAALHARRKWFM